MKRQAKRYEHIEVGHVAQNLCLQVVALGLGSVVIRAFENSELKRVAQLEHEE